MVPPPIQSRHRKPITYGRISHSNSANFKVFQDTVEGSNRNDEPRTAAPRRIRAPGLLPPSLPPMAERSTLDSSCHSIHHGSNDNNEDPFSDPPAQNPQVSTGLAYMNEVKQSAWPSLPRKITLAEKSVNHPILRNTTAAITRDTTSPSNTVRSNTHPRQISRPPSRPHKIGHYAPNLEDQGFPYHLSPSKSRSPISKDNFRRFSTRASEKGVNRAYNTPPVGSGIDQHGMADGNSRADAWAHDKTYVTKKAVEKTVGSSPPSARYKSHYEGVTLGPLKKIFGGGVRKALSPRYSIDGMKKRRDGYGPVPTITDCGARCESDGDSWAKDPFAPGQDDGFEHGIFAGESSDYIAEIPKRRRDAQGPYDWGISAQSTQNLLAQTETNSPMERVGAKSKSRKFKYDTELEYRSLGEDWDERGPPIAGAADSLLACMSGSNEIVSLGPAAQPTPKTQPQGQPKMPTKPKSKKRAKKLLPLEDKRNSKSKLLSSACGTDTDSTGGSGAEGSTADVATKKPESISTIHIAGGIKHHNFKNGELVRKKTLDEDGLGSGDSLGGCNASLLPRANPQNVTYLGALQTGGEAEDPRQDGNIPNTGVDEGTRSSASLNTRRTQGDKQSEKGKPVTRPEYSAFQGPIRTPQNGSGDAVGKKPIGSHSHGAIPLKEKSQKSLLYDAKWKKHVKKTKASKPKVKMDCEDDDVDELQMDLPGMSI